MEVIQMSEKEKTIDEYEDGYIIAGDGFYEKKSTSWISHLTKIDSIPSLALLNDEIFLKLTMPKMPMGMIMDAWEFFRKVNKEYDSEAIALIVYDDVKYRLIIPEQTVTSTSLDYTSTGIYNVIGTIHSHNTMAAFHSGTDDADESKFDGIHITLGHVNEKSFPTFSCSITKNGERFMFRLDEMFDFSKMDNELNIEEAMNKVSKKTYQVTTNNLSPKSTQWATYHEKNVHKPCTQTTLTREGGICDDTPGNDFATWMENIRERY